MPRRTKKDELSRLPDGRYYREIGRKPNRDQHRFYLGKDRAQAMIRNLQLERAWDCVERRTPSCQPVVWDYLTLQIAQALARGEAVVRLAPPPRPRNAEDALRDRHGLPPAEQQADGPLAKEPPGGLLDAHDWLQERKYRADAVRWLQDLQQDFPFVRLELANAAVAWDGMDLLAEEADRAEEEARKAQERAGLARPASGQTLHQALAAYEDWIRREHRRPGSDQLTQHAVTCLTYVGLLKQHHEDLPLDRLGVAEIDAMIGHWRRRPMGRRGKPIAIDTAKDMVKRIRHFLRWLHRSPSFRWRLPPDWEPGPVRVTVTQEERAAKLRASQVDAYSVEELTQLYEYATPWERLMMLLALNCGFGQAEVVSLLLPEIHLTQDGPSYIKRLRGKTSVYAEWKLWPATVTAIRWQMARRGKSESQALLLSRTGRPLSEPTKGNNRSSKIPRAWTHLTDRVRKDHPDFRALSYNKLRKTAATLVRRVSDGETAGVFLAHGQPTSDDLLEVYADRDWSRVHAAIDRVGEALAPMFATVAVPFPAPDAPAERPSISKGKIKRIRELRAQGFTLRKIGEVLNIPPETARRYAGGRPSTP